jgi:hypothetical protein
MKGLVFEWADPLLAAPGGPTLAPKGFALLLLISILRKITIAINAILTSHLSRTNNPAGWAKVSKSPYTVWASLIVAGTDKLYVWQAQPWMVPS